jgi:hypothetical protein
VREHYDTSGYLGCALRKKLLRPPCVFQISFGLFHFKQIGYAAARKAAFQTTRNIIGPTQSASRNAIFVIPGYNYVFRISQQ